MSEKNKDILIRAAKTFVQAFFGVLVPEIVTILGGELRGIGALRVALPPVLCAALAAGISAVWNITGKLLADEKEAVEDGREDGDGA